MSNQALSFIGHLDRREESIVMSRLQETKLVGSRDRQLVHKLYGRKPVRDVYVPATRGLNGSSVVMSKN